ncbi:MULTISPECIES: carbohydrate ABC transporter permease [Paenibacillus]|uniref:carbohydrate ABC transporter permease n=1 Tax=Paenibacillus TaxID=44249 RepID=UPI001575B423|nr:carbohydrate ABC transporter permease [Paenibacillus sp. JMULE4]NTZ19399.1 carbohydrate ABC transporter permease [Paenibacillus sp. JMULE4]
MRKKAGFGFHILLFMFIFAVLFPFLWTFLASIKSPSELFGESAFRIIPQQPTLDNYIYAFTAHPLARYIVNSLTVALLTTVYSLFVASFAAYAIARLHFYGKTLFLGLLLAVSMFPQIATISPIFLFMQSTGLRNTYLGLVIPHTTFALPLAIWYMTTFFKKIPVELEEAAKIAGATLMQTFRKVILPLAVPGMFTTAIIVFIDSWHEFLFSLTINTKQSMMTVPVGIAMFQGEYTFPWGEITAATVSVTVPIVILVLIFQKRIVSGLTSGAVKE